jgi:hypothetical protein
MKTDADLIASLVADARPVRPLRPPLWRAAGWSIVACIIVGLLVWWHGLRPDLAEKLAKPGFVLGMGAAILTGVAGAVAALTVSLPDRSRLWALLPVAPGVGWVSSVTWGCLSHWVAFGDRTPNYALLASCVAILLATSVPLSVLLFWMLRSTVVRMRQTILATGLAAAGLTAAALNLLHAFDASIMILAWHLGTAALVILCDVIVGRIVLMRRRDRGVDRYASA